MPTILSLEAVRDHALIAVQCARSLVIYRVRRLRTCPMLQSCCWTPLSNLTVRRRFSTLNFMVVCSCNASVDNATDAVISKLIIARIVESCGRCFFIERVAVHLHDLFCLCLSRIMGVDDAGLTPMHYLAFYFFHDFCVGSMFLTNCLHTARRCVPSPSSPH